MSLDRRKYREWALLRAAGDDTAAPRRCLHGFHGPGHAMSCCCGSKNRYATDTVHIARADRAGGSPQPKSAENHLQSSRRERINLDVAASVGLTVEVKPAAASGGRGGKPCGDLNTPQIGPAPITLEPPSMARKRCDPAAAPAAQPPLPACRGLGGCCGASPRLPLSAHVRPSVFLQARDGRCPQAPLVRCRWLAQD